MKRKEITAAIIIHQSIFFILEIVAGFISGSMGFVARGAYHILKIAK